MGNRLLFIVFFLLLSYWGELIEIIALGSFTLEKYWININLAIYFVTKRGNYTREVFFVYSFVIGA